VSTHSRMFPYKLPAGAANVVPQRILEGTADYDWKPNTLYVGIGRPDPPLPPISVSAGNPAATFRIKGLHHGASYVRDFALSPGDQVEIDICAFDDIAVEVIGSDLPLQGGQLPSALTPFCIVTDREVAGRERPWVILPLLIPTAGTYRVPFGAVQFFPGTNDPNFQWVSSDRSGNQITIPQAIAPPQEIEVKGEYFVTSVANVNCVWRIQL